MGLERHSTAEVGTELGRKRERDVKIALPASLAGVAAGARAGIQQLIG